MERPIQGGFQPIQWSPARGLTMPRTGSQMVPDGALDPDCESLVVAYHSEDDKVKTTG